MNDSSDTNLKLLNMIIGLCKGAAGLPKDLLKLGYTVHYIEHEFANSKGERVKPEIIIQSSQCKNTLLFEFKTGGSVDIDQLQRYSGVTQQDIQQMAYVSPQCLSTFDVVYLCLFDHLQMIRQTIQSSEFKPPLLSYDRSTINLVLHSFKDELLTPLFRKGLSVKFEIIPSNFIPFHRASKDWEFAEAIIQRVIGYMYDNQSRIVSGSLCKGLIPEWDNLGASEQSYYEGKIRDVLNLACKHDFKGYLKLSKAQAVTRGAQKVWEIMNNPLIVQPDKRRAGFKKLRGLQSRFIEYLKTGKRPLTQEELEL
jgi:hypothetical protein